MCDLQAVTARLEALENDTTAPDVAAESDDEYVMPAESNSEGDIQFGPASGKRKKTRASGGKRKTRGQLAERRGGRSFAALLLEVARLAVVQFRCTPTSESITLPSPLWTDTIVHRITWSDTCSAH